MNLAKSSKQWDVTDSKSVIWSYFLNNAMEIYILGNKFCWDIWHCSEQAKLNIRKKYTWWIQIHSNFDGCTSKFFLISLSVSFWAILLCMIIESQWIFKSVHCYSVLTFHSSSPFVRWQFWSCVWHVKSGSPLSFPVCSNKIKSGRFIEILWAFLINNYLPTFVGYKMIIANSSQCTSLAIYHLISSAHSWNNYC